MEKARFTHTHTQSTFLKYPTFEEKVFASLIVWGNSDSVGGMESHQILNRKNEHCNKN